MAKYSYEFKKKVVLAYLNGEGGYGYLCDKYGVKAHSNVEEWVAAYKQFGDEGLRRSRKAVNTAHTRAMWVQLRPIVSEDALRHAYLTKKSQPILRNLSITR